MNKKAALINLTACLVAGGVLSYFTALKWLVGSLFVFAVLFINGSLAFYEDARPGGFDNPDGTDTPEFAKGAGAVRYWTVSLGVTILAVMAGIFIQFSL